MASKAAVPKIRIGKVVTTPIGLAYLIFSVLLLLMLPLPWVNVIARVEPTRSTDAYMGAYGIDANGFGFGVFQDILIYVRDLSAKDFEVIKENTVSFFSPAILSLGILVLIGAILGIMMFLKESKLLPEGIIRVIEANEQRESIFAMLGPLIAFIGSVLFGVSYDNLPLPLSGFPNVASVKLSVFDYEKLIKSLYPGRARLITSYNIGVGAVLAFILSLIWLIMAVHKYIFTEKLNLRRSWKLRADILLAIILTVLYPWAHVVSVDGTRRWLGIETIWGAYILLFGVLGLAIIILVASRFPAGVLMREEEFISLALPPEELARRAKLLPIYASTIRKITAIIAIIWIVIFALFIVAVREFSGIYTELVKFEAGHLWTELPTWLLIICPLLGLGTHTMIE